VATGTSISWSPRAGWPTGSAAVANDVAFGAGTDPAVDALAALAASGVVDALARTKTEELDLPPVKSAAG
jgi:hypothetical protein